MKIRTFSYIQIALLFVSLSVFGQTNNGQETIKLANQTDIPDNNSVYVSYPLYAEILDWLSQASPPRLDDHLKNSTSIDYQEVNQFLTAYYSGSTNTKQPNSASRAEEFTDCDCKNIIPRETSSDHSTASVPVTKGEVHNGGSGAMEYEFEYQSKGIAFDHRHDMDFDDEYAYVIHEDKRFNHQKFELLFLCTLEGLRSNKCNCDKEIFVDGEFEFDIYQELALQWLNSGIGNDYRLGIFGMTLERDVVNFNRNKLINYEEIVAAAYQTGGYRFKNVLGQHINATPVDWQGTSQNSPFALAYDYFTSFNDADYINVSPLQNQANFLNSLDNYSASNYSNHHTSVNNYAIHQRNNETVPIEHRTVLRSNIPRIFVFTSTLYSQFKAQGNHGFSRHRSNANFWIGYKIPEQTAGYENGERLTVAEADRCCNDEFAGFKYDILNNATRETEIKSNIADALNTNINGYADIEYEFGVGLTLDQNGQIDEINADKGFAYSISSCGNCDEFITGTDDNGISTFWSPVVTLSGNLCNSGSVQVQLIGQLPPTSGTTYTMVKDGGWEWNGTFPNQQAYSVPQPVSSGLIAVIYTPGRYKIEFESPGGCKTLAIVIVEPCEDRPSGADCLSTQFGFHPNPIQPIPENSSPNAYLDWAITIFCPSHTDPGKQSFSVDVYDLNGNKIFGPQQFNNQVSGSLTIPFSVWPSTNNVLTNFVLVVTFADFTQFSRVVLVRKP